MYSTKIHHVFGTLNLAMLLRFDLMNPTEVWHVATHRKPSFFLSEKEPP